MSEENIKNTEEQNLDEAMEHGASDEHLKADLHDLSLDDLDSVAGGHRGRRKYEPRRHIGPDAKQEE